MAGAVTYSAGEGTRQRPAGRYDHIELVGLIGEASTISLAMLFGGTRLYVPARVKDHHPITRAIGRESAQALCDKHGGDTIRVPLARELRAEHYRAQGLSYAGIAARLGLTEGGVRTLFKRLDQRS